MPEPVDDDTNGYFLTPIESMGAPAEVIELTQRTGYYDDKMQRIYNQSQMVPEISEAD